MKLAILVIEDEPEVRDAIERDLESFADVVRIEPAEDIPDAREVLAEIDADEDLLALVLADHRLPGESGVDFLVELAGTQEYASVRTVLVTGQAGHEDTIRAVNEAGLDHYVAKPWSAQELVDVVREQLTEYVLENDLDPLPHLKALDGSRVMGIVRRRLDR
ncbi:MAG TPA: response regulator [Intrasporangiaceae bacterium]|nr:response regulator [Intrasporangiaceae bacterium]